jgi:hypothetical protein
MNMSLEDFGTGWFGLSIGLKQREVDLLIAALCRLKENPDSHFHAHSRCEGKGGVADLAVCIIPDQFKENMTFDGDFGCPNQQDHGAA